jgi:hypothetical protein
MGNPSGTYGELGIPDESSTPPAKNSAVSWTDLYNNLWVFGGTEKKYCNIFLLKKKKLVVFHEFLFEFNLNNMEYSLLKFQPFSSAVNVSFWYELSKRKLDTYRLSEDPISVRGKFPIGNTAHPDLSGIIKLEDDAFSDASLGYDEVH